MMKIKLGEYDYLIRVVEMENLLKNKLRIKEK